MRLNRDFSDPVVTGNYLEAILWLVLAIVLAVKGGKSPKGQGGVLLGAGGLFLVFGASDVVEAQTGAWWRPPWLLVWKGTCLVGFVVCWWKYRMMEKAVRDPSGITENE